MKKNLFFALVFIVAPVLAADEPILKLNAEQRAACDAEGGCVVLTLKAAAHLIDMGVAQGREDCRGTI